MDAYNKALEYLRNKYGYVRSRPTCSFDKKLSTCSNKKKRKELIEASTDRDYILTINQVTHENDKIIMLLLNQYYYGIGAKKDLESIISKIK